MPWVPANATLALILSKLDAKASAVALVIINIFGCGISDAPHGGSGGGLHQPGVLQTEHGPKDKQEKCRKRCHVLHCYTATGISAAVDDCMTDGA